MSDMIKACGIVIVRLDNGKYKFLMLRSDQFWECPKGKMDAGETELETALREVEEEAGLIPKDLHFKWGQSYYETEKYKKNKKFVRYYLAETKIETIEIPANIETGKKEHSEYKWLDYNEAYNISIPRIQKVLEWAKEIIEK